MTSQSLGSGPSLSIGGVVMHAAFPCGAAAARAIPAMPAMPKPTQSQRVNRLQRLACGDRCRAIGACSARLVNSPPDTSEQVSRRRRRSGGIAKEGGRIQPIGVLREVSVAESLLEACRPNGSDRSAVR